MHENLRSYMRLVEKRSREHNQAFGMLYAEGLYGSCAAIIRQEIDNLMRVDYLAFSAPLTDRDELCRDVISGARWQRRTTKGKFTDIRDVEFHTYAKDNHSWVSLAYEYSSKFIHLTNFWDYRESDPLVTMPADDRSKIVSYLGVGSIRGISSSRTSRKSCHVGIKSPASSPAVRPDEVLPV